MTVQIPNLDPASEANDEDLLLMRQNLVDKQVQVKLIRTIALASFPILTGPSTALENDVMLINRAGTNYQVRFAAIGLQAGVVMWFYSASPPNGWEPQETTSGALLAVRQGVGEVYSTPGSVQGNWQQDNVANGNNIGGLSYEQLPPHTHNIQVSSNSGDSTIRMRRGVSNGTGLGSIATLTSGGLGGVAQPHNHGNTWRPAAHIGILCKKVE